jgi:hypothetical protein
MREGTIGKSAYVFGTMESEIRSAEAKLFKIACAENSPIIYQTNERILKFL